MIERSPIVRWGRWLCSWRGVRWHLILLAWILSLIALFYAVENWRGRRAWNQLHDRLIAQGEKLDFKDFVPKPVSGDQNFAAIPVVKTWFQSPTNRVSYDPFPDRWSQAYALVSSPGKDSAQHRHFTDLVAWEMAFAAVRSGGSSAGHKLVSKERSREESAKAAAVVLEELKPDAPIFEELRAVCQRPNGLYPIEYNTDVPWSILLPHLSKIKAACQRLMLKASAELAVGNSQQALEDIKLMLRLADSVKAEPILVSHLVRLASWRLAIVPVWEGLAEHRWSDAQLVELQQMLQPRFLHDVELALRAERAASLYTIDYVRRNGGIGLLGSLSDPVSASSESLSELIRPLAPRGWYRWEQVNYCRLWEGYLRGGFNVAEQRVMPAQMVSNSRRVQAELGDNPLAILLHHRVFAKMLMPSMEKVVLRTATGQTVAQFAALGCALERYRLAKGQFPEQLGELVPQFVPSLPNDIITGQPYKYRRADQGNPVLYSVGWNVKDDQGEPGKELFDAEQGDWVWTYLRQ